MCRWRWGPLVFIATDCDIFSTVFFFLPISLTFFHALFFPSFPLRERAPFSAAKITKAAVPGMHMCRLRALCSGVLQDIPQIFPERIHQNRLSLSGSTLDCWSPLLPKFTLHRLDKAALQNKISQCTLVCNLYSHDNSAQIVSGTTLACSLTTSEGTRTNHRGSTAFLTDFYMDALLDCYPWGSVRISSRPLQRGGMLFDMTLKMLQSQTLVAQSKTLLLLTSETP